MLWFRPKLPIEPEMRDWVDESMGRFAEMFGGASFAEPSMITPTDECFPDDWDGTQAAVEPLFSRICMYMGIRRSDVDLEIFIDEDRERVEALRSKLRNLEFDNSGAAGLYNQQGDSGKPVVSLNRSALNDIGKVISTLSHELAHVVMLGGGHVDRKAPDMEPLTDLYTVFSGFGIFSANSAIDFQQYSNETSAGWSVQRLGYLSEQTYGYALALFAWNRGESWPKWSKFLKLNVKTYMKQSLSVLTYERKRR